MGTMMYCLPCHRYVIGTPVAAPSNSISHTTAPVTLSKARNFFPRNPAVVEEIPLP